ncbi:uncharacterized protein [Chironomus tepperi]|uniref:uncharacterized protein n=1 Tax=Chironomus tepperi TaxID=113505 RepID=UPI00391F1EF1
MEYTNKQSLSIHVIFIMVIPVIYGIYRCFKYLCRNDSFSKMRDSTDSSSYSAPVAVTSHTRQAPGSARPSATRSDIPRQQRLFNTQVKIKQPYSRIGWDGQRTQMPMPHQSRQIDRDSPYHSNLSQSYTHHQTSTYSQHSNIPQPSAPYYREDSSDVPPNYNESMTFLIRDHKESAM